MSTAPTQGAKLIGRAPKPDTKRTHTLLATPVETQEKDSTGPSTVTVRLDGQRIDASAPLLPFTDDLRSSSSDDNRDACTERSVRAVYFLDMSEKINVFFGSATLKDPREIAFAEQTQYGRG